MTLASGRSTRQASATIAAGLMKKGENVQVIYGLHINQVRQAVDRELGLDQ